MRAAGLLNSPVKRGFFYKMENYQSYIEMMAVPFSLKMATIGGKKGFYQKSVAFTGF